MEAALKNNVIPYKQKHKPPKNYRELHGPVQPLRTAEQIQRAKDYFLNKPERYSGQNRRDYTIFVLGLNIARRGGDLLNMKVSDILDDRHNIKNHIVIRESKTGKIAKMPISPTVANTLQDYLKSLPEVKLTNPLFVSRQKDKNGNLKGMSVNNFYKKLQELKKELEINYPIGTHSIRKTWGYHTIKNSDSKASTVATVSKAFNHSNIETSFRYFCIEQEEIDEVFLKNQF